jgi:hypothetical protein
MKLPIPLRLRSNRTYRTPLKGVVRFVRVKDKSDMPDMSGLSGLSGLKAPFSTVEKNCSRPLMALAPPGRLSSFMRVTIFLIVTSLETVPC